MKNILLLSISLILNFAYSQESILPSSDKLLDAIIHNENNPIPLLQRSDVARPWAEYETAKYIIFSDHTSFGSYNIKKEILRNLPAGITAVIYTQGSTSDIISNYNKFIAEGATLIPLLTNTSGNPFWSRDTVPVPVIKKSGELALTDALYYHDFEADHIFANYFGVSLVRHNYYYEGGNFATDRFGNCFLIDANTGSRLPDSVLRNSYGCQSITRLPFVDGIGHVDERVKIVADNIALTDTQSYVSYLKNRGFTVYLLPKPQLYDATYVNSLQINGTIFLPIFKISMDKEAIQVYKNLGFKVVPIDGREIIKGRGSIHCITMTYPDEKGYPIDGGWSNWRDTSTCSQACGYGVKDQVRFCSAPTPSNGGKDCYGDDQRTVSCIIKQCPVDGGWGIWEPTGTCSVKCGIGLQTLKRSCDSPAPQGDGKKCSGESIKNIFCDTQVECPVGILSQENINALNLEKKINIHSKRMAEVQINLHNPNNRNIVCSLTAQLVIKNKILDQDNISINADAKGISKTSAIILRHKKLFKSIRKSNIKIMINSCEVLPN